MVSNIGLVSSCQGDVTNDIISVWYGAGEMRNPLAFNLLGPGTSQSIFYSDLGLSFHDLLKAVMVAGVNPTTPEAGKHPG